MDELAQEHAIQLPLTRTEVLSIDLANLDAKIGIEVDGPAHFAGPEQRVALGRTVMKRRHLKLMGWHLVGDTRTHTHTHTCLLYTSPSPRD